MPLEKYRRQVGLSQKDLADRSGVSQGQISHLELYRRKPERMALSDCRAVVAVLAEAGAVNDAGEPVCLDDVFPPADVDPGVAVA